MNDLQRVKYFPISSNVDCNQVKFSHAFLDNGTLPLFYAFLLKNVCQQWCVQFHGVEPEVHFLDCMHELLMIDHAMLPKFHAIMHDWII